MIYSHGIQSLTLLLHIKLLRGYGRAMKDISTLTTKILNFTER